MTPSEDHEAYRKSVGVMLLNPAKEVFVGRRIDVTDEAWQMPQGGIDKGELPQDAAARELQEEIGTNNATFLAESRDWYAYDLPPALAPKLWGGRYRGQRQKWFLAQFTGQDEEIDINTKHPEFNAWRWVPAAKLPSLIVPFKRPIYQALLGEFSPFL